MEANFQRALACTLKEEGGFVNDTHDPGGATNHGVTLATFRQFIDPHATVADLKAMSDDQCASIYRQHYWNVIKGDDLPSGIDLATFDFAVNSGTSRAAKYLQRLSGVEPDGVIGPKTLAAVCKADAKTMVNLLCDRRLEFLKGLPTWKYFGKGWSGRVSRVREAALGLTAP